MTLDERIAWFKRNFGAKIATKVAGTPLSVDLITAVALQETGYLWPRLIEHHGGDIDRILEGCVGDTLDSPNRSAFPKNRAELSGAPRGDEIFAVARAALGTLAEVDATYARVFHGNGNKFCHGYGILQYDLQHVKTDPDFFLERRWRSFDACLDKAFTELMGAARRQGYGDRRSLTNAEAAAVAIRYNTGRYRPSRGLKQGFFSGGRYYGEYIFDYITRAQAIDGPQAAEEVEPEERPGPVARDGVEPATSFEVVARSGLRLRGGPGTEFPILGSAEFGQVVDVLSHAGTDGAWAVVDLQGDGIADGCMFARFLRPYAPVTDVPGIGETAEEDEVHEIEEDDAGASR